MSSLSGLVWAMFAGAFIPILAVANSRLGRGAGEPLHAPPVLFAVGLLATTLLALGATGRLPDPARVRWLQWETIAGGVIVAFYVVSATLLPPRIGIANFIVCAVSAQIVIAASVEHFGAFGAPAHPLDATRTVGICCVLLGVYLSTARNSE
jgi:transporter family-2 protein